jgi:8-hydroxy-5-deazaflavin:NADPH oxidoreductase
MNIGILGSGDVAQTLAGGFLGRGHAVKLGTRDPAKLDAWKRAAGDRASVATFAQAAQFGEVIVLATHGMATPELLAQIGDAAFAGKTVMDATNPLDVDESGFHLAVGFDDSLGERNQRAIPSANVVKVYNTVGAALMIDPVFDGGPGDMFVAGDDERAKKQVSEIVRGFGWNVVDAGGIEGARLLEPLCALWVAVGARTKRFDHAYKFIHAGGA